MLEYFALALLLLSITALFYIFIFIHDLPHMIAKKRNHPQQEAIHYACWLSLFTLHAIWPLVFLWAVSNKSTFNVAIEGANATGGPTGGAAGAGSEVGELKKAVNELQARLAVLEKTSTNGKGA
jgi:hypothetical protein